MSPALQVRCPNCLRAFKQTRNLTRHLSSCIGEGISDIHTPHFSEIQALRPTHLPTSLYQQHQEHYEFNGNISDQDHDHRNTSDHQNTSDRQTVLQKMGANDVNVDCFSFNSTIFPFASVSDFEIAKILRGPQTQRVSNSVVDSLLSKFGHTIVSEEVTLKSGASLDRTMHHFAVERGLVSEIHCSTRRLP